MFTVTPRGWVRWYCGKTRYVCSKTTPFDEVEKRWIELRQEIDGEQITIGRDGKVTLADAASRFLLAMQRRIDYGRPKPLSPYTFRDYVNTLELLRKAWGKSFDVASAGPANFSELAQLFDNRSPFTFSRTVAYVKAFFNWIYESDIIPHMPRFGPDFVKPDAQSQRDRRLSIVKSFTQKELWALWRASRGVEKCWVALGINCAFDNSDIATLTREAVDLKAGVIDFRRRKKGKVRRVIPLHPRTLRLLRAYRRPGPASSKYADYFFLDKSGLPFVRVAPRKINPSKTCETDKIAKSFARLLSFAGIRPPTTNVKTATGNYRVVYPKGDGRGFRSLRTTFANLVPPGYSDERAIIMGHAKGSVLLDNYLESVGMERLRKVVDAVWGAAFPAEVRRGAEKPHQRIRPRNRTGK
ncbi:MAG: hypothetical protein FWD61_09380 [Phycisphaerales bacterium]|nr:hypothetical protein [Phycisphaerales bacterium]